MSDKPLNVDRKNLRAHMTGRPLTITKAALEAIAADAYVMDGARAQAASQSAEATAPRIAVIPIMGIICPRHADWMDVWGGAVGCDRIAQRVAAAVADPSVAAICLLVDSPGGFYQGTLEVADRIFNAREQKPIVAVADGQACSGAYWLASSAGEFYCTPSGEVGSVGVYTVHTDWSKAYEQAGVQVTIIQAGKYKTEGNPWQPLDEEARDAIQADVDEAYAEFTKAVTRNRKGSGVKPPKGFGDGRVFSGKASAELGLVDGVKTLDEVLGKLAKKATAGTRRRAMARTVQVYG